MRGPVTLVCGLGRCGTSLVMQMLRAGGMECLGEAPAFEDMRTGRGPISSVWLSSLGPQAIKVLDPHRNIIPRDIDARVIWLDRRFREQARSQVKFFRLLSGVPLRPGAAEHIQRALGSERQQALASLTSFPIFRWSFEALLAAPWESSSELALFLGQDLDLEAMEATVRPRSAECAPGLEMEQTLLQEVLAQERARA